MSIRVVLADDHPIFRDGLVRSLEESGGFEVRRRRRHRRRGGDARRRAHAPTSPSSTSRCPAAASRRRAASAPPRPRPRIAMLTVSEAEQDVAAALRAGAIGYVLKGVRPPSSSRSSPASPHGEAHVSPALAARLLGTSSPAPRPARRPIDELTKREEDILRRVAQGMSNREVAEALEPAGEDRQALHDVDPREAAGPQPRRGRPDRPRSLGRSGLTAAPHRRAAIASGLARSCAVARRSTTVSPARFLRSKRLPSISTLTPLAKVTSMLRPSCSTLTTRSSPPPGRARHHCHPARRRSPPGWHDHCAVARRSNDGVSGTVLALVRSPARASAARRQVGDAERRGRPRQRVARDPDQPLLGAGDRDVGEPLPERGRRPRSAPTAPPPRGRGRRPAPPATASPAPCGSSPPPRAGTPRPCWPR